MAASTAPTSELGAPVIGSTFSAPILTEAETNRDLRWPQSVKTYASMLNDAQIEGLYRGATLPIRSYEWRLDPNGARPEVVSAVAADLGLDIVGLGAGPRRRTQRRFVFDAHLQDALRGIAYGHYFFEQVGEITDLLWRLRKLAARPPAVVSRIKVARDGGLESITVPALTSESRGPAGINGVELPVDRLVAYVWDREGANWRGRSMLRSCYRPWKLKDRVLRVGAINIERAGGVPYAVAPEGASQRQIAELNQLATEFRVGESAGAALPHGATLQFARASGGEEAVNYIRLQNEEMARAWLMMFMQLGQTQTGSRALGDTFVDYLRLAQHAIAGWFRDTFNEHVIEDWVEWNFGPDEQFAPLLVFTDHTADPVAGIADALGSAQDQGALPPDSQAAAAAGVRQPARRRPPAPRAAASDVGHRQPSAVEQQAGVDFEQLQADRQAAADQLASDWAAVTQAQIDELVLQVAAASSPADLAQLSVQTTGAAVLADAMAAMAQAGAQSAIDEAAAQGTTLVAPAAAAFTDRAEALALMIGQQLAQSATTAALAATGTADEIATAVRDHLEGLVGAALGQELDNAMHEAQSLGRMDAMEGWGSAARFYGSELLDVNTCDNCRAEDGTEYESLAAARADYPLGGFLGCQGGRRCRGTVVAVAREDA